VSPVSLSRLFAPAVLSGVLGQANPELPPWLGWWFVGAAGVFGLMVLLYWVLWLAALIHCLVYEPDKYPWVFLIALLPVIGPIAYLLLRVVPQTSYRGPLWWRRWMRQRDLQRLEAAAEQIGNSHQFIQWGDALRDTGQWGPAEARYEQALAKDPESLPALWGRAVTAEHRQQFEVAREACQKILAKDPQYKFGDVSLLLGKSLLKLNQDAAAREHLRQHVQRWRHPEALYLLGCSERKAGNLDAARDQFRGLLRDLQSTPAAIARKFGRWKSLARRELKSLGG
jgi:hypothetical protein